MSSVPQNGAVPAKEIHVVTEIRPRLLDIENAARYLAISARTIRRMITAGELPAIQRHAARSPYLLDIRDLDRWIEGSKVGQF